MYRPYPGEVKSGCRECARVDLDVATGPRLGKFDFAFNVWHFLSRHFLEPPNHHFEPRNHSHSNTIGCQGSILDQKLHVGSRLQDVRHFMLGNQNSDDTLEFSVGAHRVCECVLLARR